MIRSLSLRWYDWKEFCLLLNRGYECDALTYNNSDKTIRDHFGHFVADVHSHQVRTNLDRAKAAKDDEFYTQYEDIEKEIAEYDPNLFKDKVIYCCCDSEESNFVKYFKNNGDRLGIKKLIHTCYADGYDFRGEECRPYFEEADIVVTNPPFSIISEFINTLFKYNVDFLILATNLIPSYTTVFPYIRDNILNIGRNSPNWFIRPDGSIAKVCTLWYTTFDLYYEKDFLDNHLMYDESEYEKYIGTDIIDVPSIRRIPNDYKGIMGVPLSFMPLYNKKQFRLFGTDLSCIRDPDDIMKHDNTLYLLDKDGKKKQPFKRILIQYLN